MEASDADLIERAGKGDRAAFDALVLRYQDRVYNLTRRLVPTSEDALDLCQEVFLKAWRGLGTFQQEARFSTWLYRIVSNTASSFHRARRAAKRGSAVSFSALGPEEEGEHDPAAPTEAPEEVLERREARAQVAEAIASLSEEYREVILLRDLEGFSYEEIAEITGQPSGTVRSRLHRGRKELAERLRGVLHR